MAQPASHRRHLVTILVENKAGVLARVAGLFSRRGFNIFSLAVAPTDDERFSRLTIAVDLESVSLEQVIRQLDKLVNVVAIEELDPADATERELLLATVSADASNRGQVIELSGCFEGRIVDVGHDSLTMMLAGTPSQLDDFEALLRPFGIIALQRSGPVALKRLVRADAQSPASLARLA